MTLRFTLFTAILTVVAAYSGADSSAETTTTSDTTTSSIPVVTTTTVFSDVNVATAKAMVDAIVASDEDALDALPWVNDSFKQKAFDYQALKIALNAEVLESSCESVDAGVVTCRVRMSDDLRVALGWGSWEDTLRFILNASGEILGWSYESSDEPEDSDALLDWALEARPELFEVGGACRDFYSFAAECATGFLELAKDYTETEQP